jgi:hypothetical protein
MDTTHVPLLIEDDPVGPIRVLTTVQFGQRAVALSGTAPAQSEGDPFGHAGAFTWPWPDITTCSTKTL